MTTWLSVGDMHGYLDITITKDNSLILEAIEDAQAYIESETGRKFEAETDTRYYQRQALNCRNHRQLDLLHDDLLTVTELLNGDDSATEIVAANYWLVSAQGDFNIGPPYHGILLKTDVSDYWEFDTDGRVAVTGTWGYSATVPNDVHRAAQVLTAYFYRAKDAQQFEVTAIVESGAMVIPQGIPATVDRVINKYKRRV